MQVSIRPFVTDDADPVVDLSLRAWEPVFESMADKVGPEIFRELFGPDWRRYQEEDVRRACSNYVVSVAEADGKVVGFIAVDPDHHRQSIGLQLTKFGIDQIRAAGKRLAVVGTGGDPGHAPARATYERAGFTSLPSEQYYLLLDEQR